MSRRRHDIDWLRVLAILVLLYWHAAVIFYRWDNQWYVKNDRMSIFLEIFIRYVHQWHMPIFFLLSGVATWYSLGRRKPKGYVIERTKRLLAPLIFGIAVVIPPLIYIRRLSEPGFDMSYLEFYPHFYECCYPEGNFKPAHLWFIAYLYVYSLLLLPLMLWLGTDSGKRFSSKIASICELPGGILIFGIPLAVIEAALRGVSSGTHDIIHDWANNFLFSTVFIYGYLLCEDERFYKSIEKSWKTALSMAVIIMSTVFILIYTGKIPIKAFTLKFTLYQFFRGLNTWFWIVAFLGIAKKYLNFKTKTLKYANEGSYPFYILHLTVMTVIAFYVVRLDANVWPKYFIITTASVIATVIAYDIFIKRTNVTRFLFGMSPIKRLP